MTPSTLLAATGEVLAAFPAGTIAIATLVLLVFTLRARKLSGGCDVIGGGVFFLGNTLQFIRNFERVEAWILECSSKSRTPYRDNLAIEMLGMGSFSKGAIYLATPDAVKHVLKDNFDNYVKGPEVKETLREFLGDGIFTSDGVPWKTHRKVAVQMFSKRLLQESTAVAATQAAKLVRRVEGYVESGEVFDLQKLFFCFTMDTFCLIAFGKDLDSTNIDHPFAQAFDTAQRIANRRFENPAWKLMRALRSPSERELTRNCDIIRSFASTIVEGTRRKVEQEGCGLGPDLVSRFLESAKKTGNTITNKELVDMVLNFLIAGRDTTACGLSWSMYELIRNPAAEARLLREVHDATMAQTDQAHAFLDELPAQDTFEVVYGKLPWSRAVVSEALRLHPSVPKDIKYAIKADTLPEGTLVPAGVAVLYCPYVMGRNPTIWPQPLKYEPQRWIDMEDDGEGAAPKRTLRPAAGRLPDSTWPVFNAGKRLCLGRPLAYLEMQLMLATLLPRFRFEPAGELTDECMPTIVAPMKFGLLVRATARAAL